MRPCFAFSKDTPPEIAPTLSIYDEIGFWGVQASDFRTSLSAIASPELTVEINSPGGDAFAGLAMYNMLRSSGKTINVKIMGVAASAASLIAMAGDTISMPANTFMMVHNPYWCVQGNAADLRDSADALDKIQSSLTATYVSKTGMAEADMKALLSKDSWLTAAECLEQGFCTAVTEDLFATAKFDTARAELPAHVKLALAAPEAEKEPALENASEAEKEPVLEHAPDSAEAQPEEIVAAATQAGFAQHAPAWALACTSMAQVTRRIESAKYITSLCKILNKVDLGVAAIVANQSITEVRAALVLARADADAATHTDTAHEIKQTQTARSSANPKATVSKIWDSHKAQKRKP